MKFLKVIFSRFFWVAAALVGELVLVVLAAAYFNEYFMWAQIFSAVLALVIILHLLTKKQNAEYKIPWIIMVLVMPIFGLTIYILFANPRLTKKQSKALKLITARCQRLTGKQTNKQEIENVLNENIGIETYLNNTSYTQGSLNNRTKFYKTGMEYFTDLINDLKKAEKFIFMEYYTVHKGFIWNTIHRILKEKVKQGVEVRFMYDDMGTVSLLPSNYYKKLIKEGINCRKFNPFKPVLSAVYNNRDHRKITVIDGKVAYTGGINLADEYANIIQPFGMWKDSGIKIEGPAIANMTIMFLQMFDMNINAISSYKKYLNIKYEKFDEPGYVHPYGCGPYPFYQEKVGEGSILQLVNMSKKYVYITTPYLIVDHNMLTALKNAAYRGVDVRIVVPHIPDKKVIFEMTKSNYKPLLEAGVKIYEFTPGFMHSKQIIIDDVAGIIGTINLDFRSLVHHYECGVMLYKTNSLVDIKNDFIELFRVSEEKTLKNFKRSKVSHAINAAFSLITSMM